MIICERVIFRKERNPYTQSIRWTNRKSLDPYKEMLCNPEYNYLAVFPDDLSKPGYVACVLFFFDGNGTAWFGAPMNIDIEYLHRKTTIIHKKDPVAGTLLKAVTDYYSTTSPANFRMVEKITR